MSRTSPAARPLGDSALTITFGAARSPDLLTSVQTAAASIVAAEIPEIDDVVPAYLGLAVFYDSLRISYDALAPVVLALCDRARSSAAPAGKPRQHEIPVTYDGPDLEEVAIRVGLPVDQVVARHLSGSYTVDLIGFVPGFGYLSELDPSLHLPRRPQPRPRVPAGSVAIAGAQTAVYPLDTPGGWHIIGRTDRVMFDPGREPPAILRAGDSVRFVAAR